MFRTLVAAIDSSPRAAAVVGMALEIAEKFDGTVHLLRILTVPPEFPAAARSPSDDLPEVLVQRARESLLALAQGHPRAVVEDPLLGTQEPWRGILDVAKRLRADLIVIGSHGYGGWDRVLGTTAGNVSNHADRHVLVVHQPALEKR